MLQFIVVFLILVVLLLILVSSVAMGRRLGRSQLKKNPGSKLEVVTVAESSVFGLLALLIAFTFSGAYERFEKRKTHLVEEACAFATAYDYIDLVAPQYQPELRDAVRQYLDLHITAFKDIPYMRRVAHDLAQAQQVRHKIWEITVAAATEDPNQDLAQLMVAAMNNMFDEAYTGANILRIHPPTIIFLLMIGLAALGGFLIGYDSTENKQKRPIHTICYILLTSFTIYTIINLEFPRIGFIRLGYFNQMLVDVRTNMN